jgi:hemerythrin-like domain-containing protein
MKITDALFAEHLVFHNLFDHLETEAPRLKTLAELKSISALVERTLRAHSDTEEELFLGPLAHCFEQIGQREAFIREHDEIDGNLKRLQKATRVAEARRLLLAAIAHSRRHFDKEERIVFPMANRILNEKTLLGLGQKWMDQRVKVAR